jgi:hypothetical protein
MFLETHGARPSKMRGRRQCSLRNGGAFSDATLLQRKQRHRPVLASSDASDVLFGERKKLKALKVQQIPLESVRSGGLRGARNIFGYFWHLEEPMDFTAVDGTKAGSELDEYLRIPI